jgi:hypothetical protein
MDKKTDGTKSRIRNIRTQAIKEKVLIGRDSIGARKAMIRKTF